VGNFRKPGPIGVTKDTFDRGTLALSMSSLPSPLSIFPQSGMLLGNLQSGSIGDSVGFHGANNPCDVMIVQQLINSKLSFPLLPLKVDGRCGPVTIAAIEEVQRRVLGKRRPDGRVDKGGTTFLYLSDARPQPSPSGSLVWGAKVSAAFRAKVVEIAKDLGTDPNYLMAAMAFESGETFSPSVKNPKSSATGLIQFMSSTATDLGTSTAELAKMTAEAQLDYVADYFAPYKGRLKGIEDVYMAIIWPAAIGQPDSYVLFSKPSKHYKPNSGLDANNDGKVTKEEAAARVKAKLEKGRSFMG
jgi:Transglycosylase SLT domain